MRRSHVDPHLVQKDPEKPKDPKTSCAYNHIVTEPLESHGYNDTLNIPFDPASQFDEGHQGTVSTSSGDLTAETLSTNTHQTQEPDARSWFRPCTPCWCRVGPL